MNRKLSIFALTIVGTLLVTSCKNDDDEELMGNWVRVSDLDGKPRSNASAFVVNGKGYITGGYDGEYYYNDLWSYDPSLNAWTQKQTFRVLKKFCSRFCHQFLRICRNRI
jgi:N-acetylneuraminic acid mutarotase